MLRRKLKQSEPTGRNPQYLRDTARSSSVISYSSGHGSQQAPRKMAVKRSGKPKRFKLGQNFPIIIALIVIVVALVYNSIVNSSPIIVVQNYKPGDTSAMQLHSLQDYQTNAQHIIGTSFWDRFKLTFNETRFIEQFSHAYPEVTSTGITLPLLGHRPVVDVAFSTPVIILKTAQGSFVIDEKGRAVATASEVPSIANLHLLTAEDLSNLDVKLGSIALPSKNVLFIQSVTQQLSQKSITVDSASLPSAASEFDIHISGKPYLVKFNMLLDARQSAGTFIAVKERLEQEHTTPANYIDVRVDEHAYYK